MKCKVALPEAATKISCWLSCTKYPVPFRGTGKEATKIAFCKKLGLKYFQKFTGKHRCFSLNFAQFLRTSLFIEHLLWLQVFFLEVNFRKSSSAAGRTRYRLGNTSTCRYYAF